MISSYGYCHHYASMPLAVQCATSPQLFERKRLKDIPNRQLRPISAYAQILPVLGVLEREEKNKCACPVQVIAGRKKSISTGRKKPTNHLLSVVAALP